MAVVTLSDAAQRFAEQVRDASRPSALAELNRFVRWYGADRPIDQLRGQQAPASTAVYVALPVIPEECR